ncbi:hypothetical protein [Streptomyces sp. NPDC060002]|uniref:hypothetical protein n=1 Tax=Streptomyces sp. NPDC060002 TaxID=3347033 RepID=UPI0036BA4C8F
MSFISVRGHAWPTGQDCDLDTFRTLVERTTDRPEFPHASAVQGNVIAHDSERLRAPVTGRAVRAEPVRALSDGPGVGLAGRLPRSGGRRPGHRRVRRARRTS